MSDKTDAVLAKEKVRAVYPDMEVVEHADNFSVLSRKAMEVLGVGNSAKEAIADAASRLTTAVPKEESKMDTPQCEYCGPTCYRGAAHNARVEDGVRFAAAPRVDEVPADHIGEMVPAGVAAMPAESTPETIAHSLWYQGSRLRGELRDSLVMHPENWSADGLTQLIAEWDKAADRYFDLVSTLAAASPEPKPAMPSRELAMEKLRADRAVERSQALEEELIRYKNLVAAMPTQKAICECGDAMCLVCRKCRGCQGCECMPTQKAADHD